MSSFRNFAYVGVRIRDAELIPRPALEQPVAPESGIEKRGDWACTLVGPGHLREESPAVVFGFLDYVLSECIVSRPRACLRRDRMDWRTWYDNLPDRVEGRISPSQLRLPNVFRFAEVLCEKVDRRREGHTVGKINSMSIDRVIVGIENRESNERVSSAAKFIMFVISGLPQEGGQSGRYRSIPLPPKKCSSIRSSRLYRPSETAIMSPLVKLGNNFVIFNEVIEKTVPAAVSTRQLKTDRLRVPPDRRSVFQSVSRLDQLSQAASFPKSNLNTVWNLPSTRCLDRHYGYTANFKVSMKSNSTPYLP